jgi:hypothetical protein
MKTSIASIIDTMMDLLIESFGEIGFIPLEFSDLCSSYVSQQYLMKILKRNIA